MSDKQFYKDIQVEYDKLFLTFCNRFTKIQFYKSLRHSETWEDTIITTINALITGAEIVDEQVTYPTDWWQAFKQRWFPRWARLRWPVELTAIDFNAKLIFPDIKPDEAGRYTTKRYRIEGSSKGVKVHAAGVMTLDKYSKLEEA